MMTPLTRKQKLFVKEYLVDSNATRAAKAAGYSKKTARSIGQRLLTYVDIREEIDREIALRCQKLEINADYVIQGIKDIVERSQKVGQWATTLKGYELLGKYLKLFTDKTEVTGAGGCAVRIILHGGKNDGE
jgi:phage terminase small subunit